MSKNKIIFLYKKVLVIPLVMQFGRKRMRHTSPIVSHSPVPRVSAGDDSQGSQMCLRHTAPVISVTGDT